MSTSIPRRRFVHHRPVAPGTAPGTIVPEAHAAPPKMHVIAYGPDDMVERDVADPSELYDFLGKWPVVWVNVDGLGSARVIRALGAVFGLHPLALEDVVNVHQRPKVEQYGDHLFIVARMIELRDRLATEQLSIFLGPGFVLTFLEDPGDCLDPVRARIRKKQERLRDAGADYLAYSILDAVIDEYFPALEEYGERLEEIEDELVERTTTGAVTRLHEIKRDLLTLRRAVWPMRDTLQALLRDRYALISDETLLYLRDCYDHTVRIIEWVETDRELGSDLMDVYLSTVSNRTNDVMKVLTIIATIFIPLSFIASVYGMNFHGQASPLNMPELDWYFGYPFALALMAVVAALLIGFFWRKGWLGRRSRHPPATPQR